MQWPHGGFEREIKDQNRLPRRDDRERCGGETVTIAGHSNQGHHITIFPTADLNRTARGVRDAGPPIADGARDADRHVAPQNRENRTLDGINPPELAR